MRGSFLRKTLSPRGTIGIPQKSTKSLSVPSIGTRRVLRDLSDLGCTHRPRLSEYAALQESQEYYVANNKNPKQRQPGEKEPGTFHYNPGNMSGKTVGSHKDDTDQRSNKAGTIHNLNKEQQNKTDN
jgi:hypothetical protein